MQHPDLTAVIPAYNCRTFIAETIRTVAKAGPAYILVADDASTDDTAEAAERALAQLDCETRLMRNERNLGVTGNWQSAIKQVATPYCWKCDADDLVHPNYIFDAMTLLQSSEDVAIVAAQPKRIGGGAVVPDRASEAFSQLVWQPPPPQILRGLDAARFLLHWDNVASATTIYRMSAWRAVGGFDLRIGYCSDHEIWFRLAKVAAIAFFPAVGAIYRVNPHGVTRTALSKSTVAWDRGNMYLKAQRLWPDRELHQLFRKQLRIIFKAHLGSARRRLRTNHMDAWGNITRAITLIPKIVF